MCMCMHASPGQTHPKHGARRGRPAVSWSCRRSMAARFASTTLLVDRYEVGEARLLGQSRYGPVIRARDVRSRELVAVKVPTGRQRQPQPPNTCRPPPTVRCARSSMRPRPSTLAGWRVAPACWTRRLRRCTSSSTRCGCCSEWQAAGQLSARPRRPGWPSCPAAARRWSRCSTSPRTARASPLGPRTAAATWCSSWGCSRWSSSPATRARLAAGRACPRCARLCARC
jgi:hypothetical protein